MYIHMYRCADVYAAYNVHTRVHGIDMPIAQ